LFAIPGYHPTNVDLSDPSSVFVRVCSKRCVPGSVAYFFN